MAWRRRPWSHFSASGLGVADTRTLRQEGRQDGFVVPGRRKRGKTVSRESSRFYRNRPVASVEQLEETAFQFGPRQAADEELLVATRLPAKQLDLGSFEDE